MVANQPPERPAPTPFDAMNGLWNECAYAFQFVNGPVRRALCGDDGRTGPLPASHAGGWWRSIAWQASLMRLTSPSDFQAVFSAARSLLEIVVDAVLIQHEPDGPARVRDWEDSAKLKHAQAIERYFAGQAADGEFGHAIRFAQREGARINAARVARNWVDRNGAARHPDRWTQRHLGDDARAADAFETGLDLHRIYETKYRQMCWYVHGAAAVGVMQIGGENFPTLGGMLFRTCSQLAVSHARLLLRYAGLWNVGFEGQAWTELFEQLRRVQVLVSHAAMFGPDAYRELEQPE
jgi:hypothetical protein